METKKLFISQPMKDLSNEEIEKERARILEAVKKMEFTNEVRILVPHGSKWDLKDTNIELIDSFFKDAPHDAKPLWFLGKSLELLSTADIVYFGGDWKNKRGCKLEYEAAKQYLLPEGVLIIEE